MSAQGGHLGLRPEQPPLPYWILRGAVWALGFGHPLLAWNLRGRPKPGAVEACNSGRLGILLVHCSRFQTVTSDSQWMNLHALQSRLGRRSCVVCVSAVKHSSFLVMNTRKLWNMRRPFRVFVFIKMGLLLSTGQWPMLSKSGSFNAFLLAKHTC